MNFLRKAAVGLTLLFAASTVICGASIAQKAVVEQSSLAFHTGIGVLTILISLGTIALFAHAAKKP
jgi:hypothetical protein